MSAKVSREDLIAAQEAFEKARVELNTAWQNYLALWLPESGEAPPKESPHVASRAALDEADSLMSKQQEALAELRRVSRAYHDDC